MAVAYLRSAIPIADPSRVWLYADLDEYELPWVQEGQQTIVDLSYLPGRVFERTVTYLYPFLDPKTRTARVRVELDNPDLILEPDKFANVTIETEARPDVLVVPDEAVIASGRRSLVVVALGNGRFSPREVALGTDSGDRWIEVRDGIVEGDQVVTSGQFLIDSESKLQATVQKMLAAKPAGDTEHERHESPESPRETDPHSGHSTGGPPPAPGAHEGHTEE